MSDIPDSGIRAIIDGLTKGKKVSDTIEVTVGALGFPEGTDLIAINQRIKELGYVEFSDEQLLHAAKKPKVYSSGMFLSLRKKR